MGAHCSRTLNIISPELHPTDAFRRQAPECEPAATATVLQVVGKEITELTDSESEEEIISTKKIRSQPLHPFQPAQIDPFDLPAPLLLTAQMPAEKKVVETSDILHACEVGDVALIRRLLTPAYRRTLAFSNFSSLQNNEAHALHIAAKQGHVGILKLLLEAGVPADIEFGQADTRVHITALGEADTDVDDEADTVHRFPITALGEAARHNQLEACRILIQHGADVNGGSGSTATSLAQSPEVIALLQRAPKPKRLQPLDRKSSVELAPPVKKYAEPTEEEVVDAEVFDAPLEELAVSENWRQRLCAVSLLLENPSAMQQKWMKMFITETKQILHAKVIELCMVIDINLVIPHIDIVLKKKGYNVIKRIMVEGEDLGDNIYTHIINDFSGNTLVDRWQLTSQLLEMQLPKNKDLILSICLTALNNVEHKKSDVRDHARRILQRLPADLVRKQLEIVAPTLRERTLARLNKQFQATQKRDPQPWLQIKDVEVLTDDVRTFAEPLLSRFGEEWTSCFYSRMWQARAESVLGLDTLITSNDDLDLVMRCLNEGLGDANQKVLLASIDAIPDIIRKFASYVLNGPLLRELQTQLFPIVKGLCFHMGDAKELVRYGASKTLLTLATIATAYSPDPVMSAVTLSALILTHISPKQNVPGVLCRLSALRDLLKQHKIFPVAQETLVWKNISFGMAHPDAEVRKESVRTYLLAFKAHVHATQDSDEQAKVRELWAEALTSLQIPAKLQKELGDQINPQQPEAPATHVDVRFSRQEVLSSWAQLSSRDLIDRPNWECIRNCLPFADETIFIALCEWLTVLREENLIDALKVIKDAVEKVPLTTFELAMVIPRHLLPILLGLECKNTRTACAIDRFIRWLSKHKGVPKASSMVARQVVSLVAKEEKPDRCRRYLMLLEQLSIEESLIPQLMDSIVEKRCELLNGPIAQVLVALKAQHQIVLPPELHDLVRHQGGVRVPLELPPLVDDRQRRSEKHRNSENLPRVRMRTTDIRRRDKDDEASTNASTSSSKEDVDLLNNATCGPWRRKNEAHVMRGMTR